MYEAENATWTKLSVFWNWLRSLLTQGVNSEGFSFKIKTSWIFLLEFPLTLHTEN